MQCELVTLYNIKVNKLFLRTQCNALLRVQQKSHTGKFTFSTQKKVFNAKCIHFSKQKYFSSRVVRGWNGTCLKPVEAFNTPIILNWDPPIREVAQWLFINSHRYLTVSQIVMIHLVDLIIKNPDQEEIIDVVLLCSALV